MLLKNRFPRPLVLLGAACFINLLTLPSCTSDPNCDEQLSGDFAIEVIFFGSTDCSNYSGRVVRENEEGMVEGDLTCEDEDGVCTCRGGDDFGTYEVFLENEEDGTTEYAKFEVERRQAPICINRDTLQSFVVIDETDPDQGGGAGGGG